MNHWILPGILETIEITVALEFGVTVEQMRSKRRFRPWTEARHTAMFFYLMKFPKMTYRQIGDMFNRDHASVIHAKNVVCDLLKYDTIYQSKFKTIESKIN